MSISRIREQVAQAIAEAIDASFGERPEDIALEVPPRRDLGDLAWPGALPLAKVLRRAPRDIAQAVADTATWPAAVDRVEIAGPGFLNLFLDRAAFLIGIFGTEVDEDEATTSKIIVEHTNINPNKAAHIGHLRNAVLGDILVRCLTALGYSVETQNYIDDTGVQVADVVVGILYLPETELAAALEMEICRRDELMEAVFARIPAAAVPEAATDDFDDLCWDIYPRVTARYESDPEFASRRTEVLHAIEEGPAGVDFEQARYLLQGAVIAGDPFPDHAVARIAAEIASGNLRCHLATMARLGVPYDVLPHESDILHLGFWQRAFELLKESKAIRLEEEGKNSGCWVMSLASSPEFASMDDPDKILVRSNGTVTYTGKDIAYQLWKLGLLTDPDGSLHDFGYHEFSAWEREDFADPVHYGAGGKTLVRTTSDRSDRVGDVVYGSGDRVYNVIDVRQSYPQKVVKEAVRVLGHEQAADNSIHFAYEMVALTPEAVRVMERESETSYGLSDEDMAKPYVEMSGRKGIGVKADEFLDVLTSAAEDAIVDRIGHSGEVADLAERARAIAVGALRYLMARQSRNRVLAFDFEEALAFEGDTGPYLQYSAVRAEKIFHKLNERRGETKVTSDEVMELSGTAVDDDLWDLVLQCGRREEVVAQAVDNLEFSLLAQHVHGLAQLFHKLYHGHPVIPEEEIDVRRLRRAVFTVFADEMNVLLEELLGIPVPAEM
jgi:arginyl-tRNA synthetase